ncbi:MAG: hypothetical protein ABEJ58_10490 [Halodesulfurarchaeum sp.]
MVDSRWLTLEDTLAEDRLREFNWLWIIATTAYGVGDVLTTIALTGYVPAVTEGNPLLAGLLATWGLPGLVAAKLAAFALCFAISLSAAVVWEDRLLYYLPPVVLSVLGTFTTVFNIRLLLG